MPHLPHSPSDCIDIICTTALQRSDLIRVLEQYPPATPWPRFGDPAWQQLLRKPLAHKICKTLTELALTQTDTQPPELTDELYAEFLKTGNRLRFERPYFQRRFMLSWAAVALLDASAPAPELLRSLIAKLEVILSEESWALPAHVRTESGKNPTVIDLFSAETCDTLANCLHIFADVLPADLQQRIRQRLAEAFNHYLQNDYWWLRTTNNWNAVCHQGIVGAALSVETDAARLADILLKARDHLPHFLAGFGKDGACEEGPGYWDYGFGRFTVLNEQLEARTAGRLTLFGDNEHIRTIASYGAMISLSGGNLVNFSDANARVPLRPFTQQYLGTRLHKADCLTMAREIYAMRLNAPVEPERGRLDLFQCLHLFLYEPEDNGAEAASNAPKPTDKSVFFPSLGVWLAGGRDARGNLWEAAAKAGHNAEHHNHNDIGSFILFVNSVPLITEIGAPEYDEKFFSPRRYESPAARSLGHSLPLLNGCEQQDGAEFCGQVLEAEPAGEAPHFCVDITAAYPQEARCKKFIRSVTLNKQQGALECIDSIALEAPGTIEGGYITNAQQVEILSPTVLEVASEGERIHLSCDAGCRWDRIDMLHYNNHRGEPTHTKRAVLVPASGLPVQEWQAKLSVTIPQ